LATLAVYDSVPLAKLGLKAIGDPPALSARWDKDASVETDGVGLVSS
jgi:hypothetical protein